MVSDRLVLVVDDDAIVLRILADQIARAGYEVTPATSIAEARGHLNQTLFAVVIADQSMPELSGIEFLRECGAIQPLASRVLVTGNVGLQEVDQALREGEICRLLIKPWTRFDLISLFQQVYERYELLCEKDVLRRKIAVLEAQVTDLMRRTLRPESPAQAEQQGILELSRNEQSSWRDTDGNCSQPQQPGKGGLETFGQVASSVAHEFNNALIPILGYIELMLEKDQLLEDKEKARHYLKLVLAAAKGATRVADRLREFYQQAERSEAPKAVLASQAEVDYLFDGPIHTAARKGRKLARDLKILIVDDEKTSRDLVTWLLEADHHKITAASSGTEALEFLRNGGYDLIVTDQGMAGMTGATFVEAVREFGNSPPVVMLTGFGGLMKSSGLTPHGVDLILNKPVTRQALRSALIAIFPSDAPRE